MRITILGAGAMGAALAKPLLDRGHETHLWATPHDAAALEQLRKGHPHPALGAILPAGLHLHDGADSLAQALDGAQCVILAVSTRGVLPVMAEALPLLPPAVPLINVAKGFVELGSQVLLVTDALRELGASLPQPPRILALAGPSIASELAQGHWTAVCLTGEDQQVVRHLSAAMTTDYFGVLALADTTGMEICAAFKNMYAIALAWPEGKSGGGLRNLKGILYLQVLEELKLLVAAAGGDPQTVLGLPGLGDFIATASGGRNGELGRHLGLGKTLQEALAALSGKSTGAVTVEGLDASALAHRYLENLEGISSAKLPVFTAIGDVLNRELSVDEALKRLVPQIGIFGTPQ